MKHKISFCHSIHKPIEDCYNCDNYLLNKPNQIIRCSKCGDNPGLWYYNGSSKIWIPNCECPNIMEDLGSHSIVI